MKVTNMRCHVGAQIGAEVFTSLDSTVHGADMRMTPQGVFVTGEIKGTKIQPHFIPHSTIASIRLDPASYEESITAPKLELKKAK